MMEKLIRDGKVGVLYSPGFGAGWYSWNSSNYGEELLFDPMLVNFIEKEKFDEARNYITLRFPEAYDGGVNDLQVEWITVGTAFRIHEYDGAESIEIKEDMDWVVA
jgi:hypothetical protein